ncbi:MAG TPA: UDP-3-O-(3-hydroxymyristoyl)glucosamine N-acyltransferase [Gemmataceae bacterium]|nr:UDP-3-O-(3-hydroxymyristoyl)glucosamine N-acyltransferase [Gemmataceae bacterium]
MQATVRELAALVRGEVHGDGGLVITAARPLGQAQPGEITFVESERHARQLASCRASAAVVPVTLPADGLTLIRVADPLAAFITIVRHLHGRPEEPPPPGIDPRAVIHPTARLGEGVSVQPFAVVGEGSVLGARCRLHVGVVVGRYCRLGDDVVLHPHVVLYDGTVLGNRVVIHAHAVIGADGFGYRFQNGRHVKVPQLGQVEIGDDVEIGAGSTIDRGTFGATQIGEGTKIDNLVQVAHNCRIGRHNVLAGQVGIAGSSSTGDYVMLAGQVGVADHVHIGDRTLIGAQSGVARDVPAGARLLGSPAIPEAEQKRILLSLPKLPQMHRDLRRLQRHLGLEDDTGTG